MHTRMDEVEAAWQADRVRQELEAEAIAARLAPHRIRCANCHGEHESTDQVFACHAAHRIGCGNCHGVHASVDEVAGCYDESAAWEAEMLAEQAAELAFARDRERLSGDGLYYDPADWL